jgi:hypothetical protein
MIPDVPFIVLIAALFVAGGLLAVLASLKLPGNFNNNEKRRSELRKKMYAQGLVTEKKEAEPKTPDASAR